MLSVRLPVRAEPYDHDATMAFFENLLPEGEGRDLIAQARQFSVSDVPGLLGMVGGDCAGAVTIWPEGTPPPARPAVAERAGLVEAWLREGRTKPS